MFILQTRMRNFVYIQRIRALDLIAIRKSTHRNNPKASRIEFRVLIGFVWFYESESESQSDDDYDEYDDFFEFNSGCVKRNSIDVRFARLARN